MVCTWRLKLGWPERFVRDGQFACVQVLDAKVPHPTFMTNPRVPRLHCLLQHTTRAGALPSPATTQAVWVSEPSLGGQDMVEVMAQT